MKVLVILLNISWITLWQGKEYILKTYVGSKEKEASEKTKIGVVQKLYKKGNSVGDIADILDASVKEVEQWLGLVRA